MAVDYLSTGICAKILIGHSIIKVYRELYGYIVPMLDCHTYYLFWLQGTWAFQSLRLSQRPKTGQPQVIHNRLDDLESFYHVLFWVSLQHARHGLDPEELYDDLNRLFDHALIVKNKSYSNSSKLSHMTSDVILLKAEFENPPLCDLLLKISANFRCLYIGPPTSKSMLSDSVAEDLAEQGGESYQKVLQIYKRELDFLNSDAKSNWMELKFEEALRRSADEWGPTSHILNQQTPPTANKTKRRYSDMSSRLLGYNQVVLSCHLTRL